MDKNVDKVFYCICCDAPADLTGNDWKIIKLYSAFDDVHSKNDCQTFLHWEGKFTKKVYTEKEWERIGFGLL